MAHSTPIKEKPKSTPGGSSGESMDSASVSSCEFNHSESEDVCTSPTDAPDEPQKKVRWGLAASTKPVSGGRHRRQTLDARPSLLVLPRGWLLVEWRDSRKKRVKMEAIQPGFLHNPFSVAKTQGRLKFSFPETSFSCGSWQCFCLGEGLEKHEVMFFSQNLTVLFERDGAG